MTMKKKVLKLRPLNECTFCACDFPIDELTKGVCRFCAQEEVGTKQPTISNVLDLLKELLELLREDLSSNDNGYYLRGRLDEILEKTNTIRQQV